MWRRQHSTTAPPLLPLPLPPLVPLRAAVAALEAPCEGAPLPGCVTGARGRSSELLKLNFSRACARFCWLVGVHAVESDTCPSPNTAQLGPAHAPFSALQP